jgi:hypothetical protein
MNVLGRPALAIGFGAFLLCPETCLHFDSLRSLPEGWVSLPIYDWAAGLFLLCVGVRGQRRMIGAPLLIGVLLMIALGALWSTVRSAAPAMVPFGHETRGPQRCGPLK